MDIENNPGLFCRQSGIVTPDELPAHIVLIGAGGIGSWTALALAKMGLKELTIVDHDNIEDANIAPQFYRYADMGKNKAEVLAERLTEEMGGGIKVHPIVAKWEDIKKEVRDDFPLDADVLIMAVDSIDTRKMIWEDVKQAGYALVIDGRMAKEMFQLYLIDPESEEHIKTFEKSLFSSEEAAEIPCTERAVAYNQFAIAGVVGAQIKQYAKSSILYKRIFLDLTTMDTILTE